MVLLCLLVIVFLLVGESKREEGVYEGDTQYQTIEFRGKTYRINPDIRTLLFLGIDQEAEFADTENPGENGQSDTICLFLFDTEKKEGKILPISRDTMTEIDIYDIRGEKYMTQTGQIALQFAYGDGQEKSCRLMAEKVSQLLWGKEIDSYFAVRMDGIAAAADAAGGVPVTVRTEETKVDERFRKGAVLTLSGELAEKFVRGRETDDPAANSRRMERQILFLEAFADRLGGQETETEIQRVYEAIRPYVYTDLTVSDLRKLTAYDITEERLELPGKITEADGYAQFIPDQEKVKELVVSLFYKEVK